MRRIKSIIRQDEAIYLTLITIFLLALYFYKQLPGTIPIQWDSSGNVTGYGPKFLGTFTYPLINLGVYIVLFIAFNHDFRFRNFPNYYKQVCQVLKLTFTLIILFFQCLVIMLSLNCNMSFVFLSGLIVSVLIIIFGYVMRTVYYNSFIRFTFPWISSDKKIWHRVTRFAAHLRVISGEPIFILTFITGKFAVYSMLSVFIIVLLPFAYYYLLHTTLFKQQ